MFEFDKLENQKMNSISHQSYSNMKKIIEWSGKLEYNHLKKLLTKKTMTQEYFPCNFAKFPLYNFIDIHK